MYGKRLLPIFNMYPGKVSYRSAGHSMPFFLMPF